MMLLSDILKNPRIVSRDVEEALVSEFLGRGYKKIYSDASRFQSKIEREFPGINKWVSQMNMNRRSIEDVVADKLKIPGN